MTKQTDKQAKYNEAQKARGFTQVRLWVPIDNRDELRKIAATFCDDVKAQSSDARQSDHRSSQEA